MDVSQRVDRIDRRISIAATVINVLGATLVFVYLLVVFPPEAMDHGWLDVWGTIALAVAYLIGASVYGNRKGRSITLPLRRWAASGQPPTDTERREVLRLPGRLTAVCVALWGVSIPVFAGAAALTHGMQYACEVGGTLFLAGLTTCAAVYLGNEKLTRPAVAIVLADQPPAKAGCLGIGPRIMLTWVLFSGVPFLMLASVPLGRLPEEPEGLIAPILFISAIGLVGGLVAMKLATHSVAGPVRRVRKAMDAVAAGDVSVTVPVDDGSEVGRLQAGFNAMVEGLRERETLRDLFGRQVGPDVAREALERGIRLGGERRQASVLFADVVGSTRLAATEEPERVVELLNGFFAAVVEVVEAWGGSVDKFEGDAALCVFGAPVAHADHAARALGAARELRERLDRDSIFEVAIGVSCGTVVAGNVGSETRFEYTVIGDPVNEAARLTELAKGREGMLLASGSVIEAAGPAAARSWHVDGEVVLRGRRTVTRLAEPLSEPSRSAATA
jgi:adenylate cyclase